MRFPGLFYLLSTMSVSAFQVSRPFSCHSKPRPSCLHAATEIATLGELGPLDFGLFLVPVAALVVRASAINDRNELQLEIETSQKFLEDAKQRLVKVEEAIKLSSIAGVLSFAFVLAIQLGVFTSPVPEPVLATPESVPTPVVEVAKETKAEPKDEAKLETKLESLPEELKKKDEPKSKTEEEVEKIEESSSEKKEVTKNEDDKTIAKDSNTKSEGKDDERAGAPYEDLLKKMEDPPKATEPSKESEEAKLLEEQQEKEKAEQKAKDFVELEGAIVFFVQRISCTMLSRFFVLFNFLVFSFLLLLWVFHSLPSCRVEPMGFSGHTTVQIQGRGNIPIYELRSGDLVRIRSKHGNSYTRVYAVAYWNELTEFLQLSMMHRNNTIMLEVTPSQFLFIYQGNVKRSIAAKNAQNTLISDRGRTLPVQQMHEMVTRQGRFAPLTQTGDLIVSGIQASCYADTPMHLYPALLQLYMAPYRVLVLYLTPWVMISPDRYLEHLACFSPWLLLLFFPWACNAFGLELILYSRQSFMFAVTLIALGWALRRTKQQQMARKRNHFAERK
ncbi:hypothetical protein FisN_9Lh033 [Fistulifera solaris]|uniref:Hedgehog protein Hint domain-containing protein n=1 Tax=Fistulifera solaris TaxID=1519565 RepID=A0A1Z5KKH0_FISSO|nr:hypothetical protein FisN_9Lh033 [Fistulifera solaris]|eukprot:GAX26766.1 hypothetical protein FisN_9Lh033 [Fistulifera solaris]